MQNTHNGFNQKNSSKLSVVVIDAKEIPASFELVHPKPLEHNLIFCEDEKSAFLFAQNNPVDAFVVEAFGERRDSNVFGILKNFNGVAQPVIVVAMLPGRVAYLVLNSLEKAVRKLGADAFLVCDGSTQNVSKTIEYLVNQKKHGQESDFERRYHEMWVKRVGR